MLLNVFQVQTYTEITQKENMIHNEILRRTAPINKSLTGLNKKGAVYMIDK